MITSLPERTGKRTLSVADRTILMDVSAARISWGVEGEIILDWADEGRLQWVWDVSSARFPSKASKPHVRALRFWGPEIIDPPSVSKLSLAEVISSILPPSRNWFRGGEVMRMLLISRPHVAAVRFECRGIIDHHSTRIGRDDLASYLRRRWLGAGTPDRTISRQDAPGRFQAPSYPSRCQRPLKPFIKQH
jgi:hypothetical protein